MSKSYTLESEKILHYITNNPLSFTRNIADNYSKKRANYTSIQKIIEELKNTKKIASVGSEHPAYYVLPNQKNFAKTLSPILLSENIMKPKFQKLKYEDSQNDWNIEQIISNLICLFHLKWKIHTLEKSKKKSTVLDLKRFQKKFSKEYDLLMEDYSLDDFQNAYTFVISENYSLAKIKLISLSTHKFPLKKIHNLMKEYLKTKSMRAVADKHGTTTKNVRRLLGPVLDNRGIYSWRNAFFLHQKDSGSTFVSFDPDIFRLMVNSKATDEDMLGYLYTAEPRLYEDDSNKIWLEILKKTVRT